ncbi:MAG: glutaredoxin [Rhodobacteraceae bacterium]|nr:glutaredoxin [Paracoccaceae bacterium]MCY4251437.1 glutaredoxin [Paracoccaceae bacterium]MCY4308813.1 glutaredoxin [Paracoccaceae bacterium]
METTDDLNAVPITLYKWAGAWGPFKVKIPCGECTLTLDIIKDTMDSELADVPVKLEVREWLSEWWKPLLVGGWHAPIVIVDGKMVNQGNALNRGVLTEAVINAYVKRTSIKGNKLFGKVTCPHCTKAKQQLSESNIDFTYHDVVKEPLSLYEMLARVKPIVGPKTPITVPQIWLEGNYVGGANELSSHLKNS